MSVSETTVQLQLAPYIYFYGRCEEALAFYKAALGGSYELQHFEGSPMADRVSPGFRSKVMHATFTGPGLTFMASDGSEGKTIDPDAGNIVLSLFTGDRAHGERVFAALADGGRITTALEDVFWGGKFGSLIDRFGIEWMMSTP